MSELLNAEFIESIGDGEYSETLDGRALTIRKSTARGGYLTAELEVVEGTSILGYITSYGRDEHGAIAAHLFGRVGSPRVFRQLTPALREILANQPRR